MILTEKTPRSITNRNLGYIDNKGFERLTCVEKAFFSHELKALRLCLVGGKKGELHIFMRR